MGGRPLDSAVRWETTPAFGKHSRGHLLTPAHHYQIRVAGTVPPEVLLDLDHLRASTKPAETMIHGALPDQAALCGLLTRLETSGARVLEVHRLPGGTRRGGR